MSWWNLGGMNPEYKDFMEKHPDKTMIGLTWSMWWRFGILGFVCEIILFLAVIAIALLTHG